MALQWRLLDLSSKLDGEGYADRLHSQSLCARMWALSRHGNPPILVNATEGAPLAVSSAAAYFLLRSASLSDPYAAPAPTPTATTAFRAAAHLPPEVHNSSHVLDHLSHSVVGMLLCVNGIHVRMRSVGSATATARPAAAASGCSRRNSFALASSAHGKTRHSTRQSLV
jgi:hypothetical protein